MSDGQIQGAKPAAVPLANAAATPLRSSPPSAEANAVSTNPVQRAIATAARETRTDFDFLLAQAKLESSLNPSAKAATSTASGLFQFIENTWLDTLYKHGDKLGLGAAASQLRMGPNGVQVANPAMRAEVLALRNDPQAASLMAGALAQDNRAMLSQALGREPQAPELYLAHFLGAGGASRFLSALESNPAQSAASLFAQPASANRAIFFASGGAPRSLEQVMALIDRKVTNAMSGNGQINMSDVPGIAQPTSSRAQFVQKPAPTAPVLPTNEILASRPLSASLRESLNGIEALSPAAGQHVKAAYARLEAFGL
ncbi:lytic transglycosylase domain-containing protein [Altererythrobacter lutimaris]|uniref:Lytic transglycosylase domain-containing protein n=1 Tax=Altererythrobacter lutimaris TaxID=2743979 RepID=A0A850H653_9SPHN|nr:lytic transglycosylase domain-containing protein [Altererythrobacter lutimaris]NVE93293.1 lytic transglycosylase domain-containing protein [Altererythrobacter lutimaris]